MERREAAQAVLDPLGHDYHLDLFLLFLLFLVGLFVLLLLGARLRLLEQLVELVLLELRLDGQQVDPHYLVLETVLVRGEDDEASVGGPVGQDSADVGQVRELNPLPLPLDFSGVQVSKEPLIDREVGDPGAVRRPAKHR
jgi:hypothetical protein